MIYELFLDEKGEKISKSKGNGLTIEEWLTYGTEESLGFYLFREPKSAKQLHIGIIPRAVDEYWQFREKLPTVMVMEEMPKPRDAFVLIRGEYDKKGAKVSPATPAQLPALPKDAPNNRLGLARWLIAKDNPLTARVAVNRMWQLHFGKGLVRTAEDFGTQGEFPTHPELLDWLATEYIASGWDTKAILKKMALSATYRQSSDLPVKVPDVDPSNRLLYRAARFRHGA